MPRRSRANPDLRQFIIQNVPEHPRDIARVAAERFKTTRVTVNRYLSKLVQEGLLFATGVTKGRSYSLRPLVSDSFDVPINPQSEEHVIYDQTVGPHLAALPENIRDICQYGFSEMINNVIDHSETGRCFISFVRNALLIDISITDFGVGIFQKIQKAFGLSDPRHALLELSKGKLTTDPDRHSGEGIFFTSRMFTEFTIHSGDLFYIRKLKDDDEWLIEVSSPSERLQGTRIGLEMELDTDYTVQEIFRRYESNEDEPPRGFSRTHVPVRLARYAEEQLVSRSQARRVLARFERFEEVLLDFDGVNRIGQAFADEIFRVFARQHPKVAIYPIRTTPDVDAMINHVKYGGANSLADLGRPRRPEPAGEGEG